MSTPELPHLDPLALPFSRRVALVTGWTDRDLRRLVRNGDLDRVRHGDYRMGAAPEFAEERHLQLVRATAERFRVGSGSSVSHASAAVLFGARVWGLDLSRVHVTRPGRSGASSSGAVHPYRAIVNDDEITEVDGIAVTTPERTILDVARSAPFTQAVVIADGLMRLGLVDPDALESVIERAVRRGSAGGARRVAAFADGLSESVSESRSRVMMAQCGLPVPKLQTVIRTQSGAWVGRVDFDLDDFATVGECDGLGKYFRYLRPGETPADAVIREKVREDALRSTGRQVVRWIPRELSVPLIIVQRFERAFGRAGFPDWRPGPPRVPLAPR